MQLKKAERENSYAHFAGHDAPSRFSQRIGSTIYTVNIIPKEGKPEVLEDKILRMMKNDLKIESQSAIIRLPQVETERYRRPKGVFAKGKNHEDWLPERGSV